MTKLEFPPEPYMLFRLEKLPQICCLLLYWVLSSFVDPYERSIMLLKSRSRTHHPDMHCCYTGVGAKTCLPSRSTQKCSTPTLGVNPKTCLLGFSSTKVLIDLSQSFIVEKRHGALQMLFKSKKKKRKKRDWEKMDKYPRYLKQWVLRCPPEKRKEMNKIAPVL